jgi:hypothetical protein
MRNRVALVIGGLVVLASSSATAHDFSVLFADGCVNGIVGIARRAEHSNPACRGGHQAAEVEPAGDFSPASALAVSVTSAAVQIYRLLCSRTAEQDR